MLCGRGRLKREVSVSSTSLSQEKRPLPGLADVSGLLSEFLPKSILNTASSVPSTS